MKVLLYEPHPGGHRFEYLARVLPALSELNVEIIVASSSLGFSSDQFEIHLREMACQFQRVVCDDSPVNASSMYSRAAASYRELRRIITSVRPNHIYLPSADGLTQFAALNKVVRRSGTCGEFTESLHFAGAFGYQLENAVRNFRRRVDESLFKWAPWDMIWHVDPWQLAALRERSPEIESRSLLLPDPAVRPKVTDRTEARSRLAIPQGGTYFSLIGPISRRKRLDLLLAAFDEYLKRHSGDARLLIAGKLDSNAKKMVHQLPYARLKEKIVVLDRIFSADEMDMLVPASDVVVVPYDQHFGSSGIVLRAAAAGRPVVTSNIHWLAATVPRFQLGITCPIDDSELFCGALQAGAELSRQFEIGESAQRYLEFQSVENFRATWVMNLRKRLGLPSDSSRIDWRNVMSSLGQE